MCMYKHVANIICVVIVIGTLNTSAEEGHSGFYLCLYACLPVKWITQKGKDYFFENGCRNGP